MGWERSVRLWGVPPPDSCCLPSVRLSPCVSVPDGKNFLRHTSPVRLHMLPAQGRGDPRDRHPRSRCRPPSGRQHLQGGVPGTRGGASTRMGWAGCPSRWTTSGSRGVHLGQDLVGQPDQPRRVPGHRRADQGSPAPPVHLAVQRRPFVRCGLACRDHPRAGRACRSRFGSGRCCVAVARRGAWRCGCRRAERTKGKWERACATALAGSSLTHAVIAPSRAGDK